LSLVDSDGTICVIFIPESSDDTGVTEGQDGVRVEPPVASGTTVDDLTTTRGPQKAVESSTGVNLIKRINQCHPVRIS